MARKKVNLQLIANDSTRRASLKKRRAGVMKKASELSTLCGVDACVLVYGDGGSSSPSQLEVWPPAPEARRVVERFVSLPKADQERNMVDQEKFLRSCVEKLDVKLRAAERDNRDREAALLLHEAIVGRRPGLAGLSVEQLASLGCKVDMRLQSVRDRIEFLRAQKGVQQPPPPPPQPQPTTDTRLMVPYGYATGADVEAAHQQGLLMDVVNTGGDLSNAVYSGFGSGNGSYGGLGAGGSMNMMQLLGNMDAAGFTWAYPGPFPPV